MTPTKGLHPPEREGAPDTDPAIVAGKEAQEAAAAFSAIAKTCRTSDDENTPEFVAADKRTTEADAAFADAPVTSVAGALAKMRELVDLGSDDNSTSLHSRHIKTVTAFLEGLAGAPSVVVDDPAVAAFAELEAAWTAFDALPGDVEEQIDEAAYRRYADARDAVRDAVPVSLAGVVGKVRALLEPYRADVDAVGLDHDYDLSAKAMLAFLEGEPAPAPKPDPVVVLFAEWGAVEDEIIAFGKAHPDSEGPDVEKQRDKLIERLCAVEDQIIETATTSVGGIAVKLRLLAYMKFPMKGLPELHRTPAKDTDFGGFVEAWREESGLYLNERLLIGSLRDAERLAGVS